MTEIVKNRTVIVIAASFMSLFQLHANPVYSINSTIKNLSIKKKHLCFSTVMPITGQGKVWGVLGGWFASVAPKVNF